MLLGAVLVRRERFDEARKAIAEARALKPKLSVSRLRAGWRTLAPRYREKILTDLERAGLPE